MSDDFSELLGLAADLSAVPDRANRNVKKAIEVTARNIKDDWRQGAEVGRGDGFTERYASSIFYDVEVAAGEISAEIGPELGRPGGSAGFLEDGGQGVKAAPQHAGRDAVRANENDFQRGLEIAIFEALADEIEG